MLLSNSTKCEWGSRHDPRLTGDECGYSGVEKHTAESQTRAAYSVSGDDRDEVLSEPPGLSLALNQQDYIRLIKDILWEAVKMLHKMLC